LPKKATKLKLFDSDNKEYQVLEKILLQIRKKLDESLLKLDTLETLVEEKCQQLIGLIKLSGEE
jgi:hypothetical protein